MVFMPRQSNIRKNAFAKFLGVSRVLPLLPELADSFVGPRSLRQCPLHGAGRGWPEALVKLLRYALLRGLGHLADHAVRLQSRVVCDATDKLFLALGAHLGNHAVALRLQSGYLFRLQGTTLARFTRFDLKANLRKI